MIIQSSIASSRKKSHIRAKQSVCSIPPSAAVRRAVSLAPTYNSGSIRSTSSRSTASSDDEGSSITEGAEEDFSLVDISNQNLGVLPDFIAVNSSSIEHLILDGNQLTEQAFEEIPFLGKLKSLSLNANKVKNIGLLLQFLSRQCPNLSFLSLIGNPGWPHPIIHNANPRLYQCYALAATKFLPSLRFLDTASVTGSGSQEHLRAQHCNII